MTIREICDELEISRRTFYEWRAKKTAPTCVKLPNGELRVRKIDFDRWIDAHTEVAA
jgi:predicted DNA-binding transcriptional regulator AlpA